MKPQALIGWCQTEALMVCAKTYCVFYQQGELRPLFQDTTPRLLSTHQEEAPPGPIHDLSFQSQSILMEACLVHGTESRIPQYGR